MADKYRADFGFCDTSLADVQILVVEDEIVAANNIQNKIQNLGNFVHIVVF